MKDLYQYDSQLIRVEAEGGLKLEGFVSAYPAEYGLHEFGREEESIRIDDYQLFEGDIIRIEKLGLRLVLKEFSPRGNHTGTFDGQRELRGDGYVGTFTNNKGKKYHFELMQQYE